MTTTIAEASAPPPTIKPPSHRAALDAPLPNAPGCKQALALASSAPLTPR